MLSEIGRVSNVSGGSGGVPPESVGGTLTVSGGGETPLSDGQLHTRLGKSICSATATKLRSRPSIHTVTGVACPVSRTITAACLSASAAGEYPPDSTESARRSNSMASRAPSPSGGLGPVPSLPQASTNKLKTNKGKVGRISRVYPAYGRA